MVEIHWWEKQQSDGVRKHSSWQSVMVTWQKKPLPPRSPFCSPPAVSPLWQRMRESVINPENIWGEPKWCHEEGKSTTTRGLSLLAIEGRDLKAEAAVITVDRHDGAVVEVCDQPARYLATALLHQVTTLCKEVLTLPGCWHQTCLTERQTEDRRVL